MTRSALLLALLLAVPALAQPYERPRWADADHDCLDTRAEVLVASCAWVEIEQCRVRRAECLDLFSGMVIATDTAAQALLVDHLLPAAEAWKRRAWTSEEFAAFFNDPLNLSVIRARANLQKSDKMPGEWCPENRGVLPSLAVRFLAVARRYRIPLTDDETAALREWYRGRCKENR